MAIAVIISGLAVNLLMFFLQNSIGPG
jgi:hypothetical protein